MNLLMPTSALIRATWSRCAPTAVFRSADEFQKLNGLADSGVKEQSAVVASTAVGLVQNMRLAGILVNFLYSSPPQKSTLRCYGGLSDPTR